MNVYYIATVGSIWTYEMKPLRERLEIFLSKKDIHSIIVPYAGRTRFDSEKEFIYIDINDNMPEPYIKGDCHDILQRYVEEGRTFDCALIDPPFSEFQCVSVYHNKKMSNVRHIKDLCAVLGVKYTAISGFNSNGMGVRRGFIKKELMINPIGGNRNDFLTVFENKECSNCEKIMDDFEVVNNRPICRECFVSGEPFV